MPAAPVPAPARRWPGDRLLRTIVPLLLVATSAAGACSAERPELADEESSTTADDASATTTTAVEDEEPVEVAHVIGESIEVFPDATTDVAAQTIVVATASVTPGVPLVFLVNDRTDDRIEVHLPGPPAGSTGWVREADVSLARVPFRIEVALSGHRLRVYEDEDVVLDEPIGIGTTDRPPPGGLHYLKELLQPPDPTGPYGSFAYGLSGFTTTLSSFEDGRGFVGIHGTTDPATVGGDTETGSIRLADDVIARLVNEIGLPLGTPVEILP